MERVSWGFVYDFLLGVHSMRCVPKKLKTMCLTCVSGCDVACDVEMF